MQSSETNQSSEISLLGDKIYCPSCKSHTRFLKVPKAAQIASVDRRTIYRYVETGAVYAIKVAGKTIRICCGCLFKEKDAPFREKDLVYDKKSDIL